MGMPYKNEDEFVRGQKMKIILIIIMLLLAAIARAQTNHQVFQSAYDQVNQIRKEKGLPPLMRSGVLELKAGRWLNKMHETHSSLTHDRTSKEAELLTDCANPVKCWMESKPHKQILLSKDYTKIGIVLVEGDWCARLD